MAEEKSDLKEWPSDPKHYQWKGTISAQNGSWHVLCHCKPRKEDVFLKIKSSKHDSDTDIDIEQLSAITKKLLNIQHPNLLTPVHAFSFKSEIYVVYPRHSGGPVSEALVSHYPNGIDREDIVASILYDTALGLQNLHQQQQCHRNIRSESIHIDIDEGISLLSDFKTLKDIKWKHAKGRRNTQVTPEREPFTDPLMLLGMDEDATWYTSDIYAFGITALQLTYGSTPTISTKNVLNGSYQISTDLYEKKCPFSKPFQSLIKECCGPLKERISVNKLVEHKFFKGANCPNPEAITNFFGHILKSTEQRINSSLAAPPSMKTNNIDVDGTLLGGNENVNDSNNGPNILLNGNALNNGNEGSSHTGPETADSGKGDNPISLTDSDFSFSTRLDPSMLENIRAKSHETPPPTTHTDPPTVGTIHENEEASPKQPSDIVAPNGPTMHNPPITSGGSTSVSYNDPASSHHLTPRQNPTQSPLGHPVDQEFQVTDELMQSTRNYRFSFSESKSQMNCEPGQDTPVPTPVPSQKIGRFKVDTGRLSVSGNSQDGMELSDTHDSADGHDDDSVDEDSISHEPTVTNTGPSENNPKKGRFMVSPVAPEQEQSADEDGDVPNEPQQHIPNGQVENAADDQEEEKWTPPNIDKSTWTAEQCANWVSSLAPAYEKYAQGFIDNGVDGEMLMGEDDEGLKELLSAITDVKLHLKKIIKEWNKLQT